tara:strand:- start:10 stop:465 length:456 start_codon:yes stop_codon:yes gene_type:complete
MILDERAEFCDATALNTGGAGTYLVGDVIDLETARDIGAGHQMYLVIQVDTAVTSGGSATVKFHLASDSVAAIAADGSETIHLSTDAIGKATLVAGYELCIPVPPQMSMAFERYVGVEQVTGTAAVTAGKINAFLTYDPPANWTALPDASN